MRLTDNDVQTLLDGDLIDEVVERVWAKLGMLTRESVLVDELVQRFMVYGGLTSTPKGILRDKEHDNATNG